MQDAKAPPSYELSLGAIGVYLDSEGAAQFKVLEAPHGFAVQFAGAPSDAEQRVVFFHFRDLRASVAGLNALNSVRLRLGAKDKRYRDVLSAIGYNLDTSHAVSILIDEVDDDLLVTYEYYDPQKGYVLRKHMARSGPSDRKQLLNDPRRGSRPRSAARWKPRADLSSLT